MSLVTRLEPLIETVAEMEAAAEGRYQEGKKLVQEGFYHAGIYLLGYAAEIGLKTALCRVDSALLSTAASFTVTVDAYIGPARRRWKDVFGGNLPDRHDLLFLALSLEDARRLEGKPQLHTVSPVLSQLFNVTVGFIYDHWFVAMRYRHPDASLQEAQQMLDSVEWLRSNYQFLWS